VAGVDLVIHAATGGGTRAKADAPGTRNLLAACKEAGTAHFFYISIVGIERIPLGYYKAKLECERLIDASGVPWSNLRATQFHTLIDGFLRIFSRIPLILPVPKSFKFQPIETGEVADHMVADAAKGPVGRLPDIGGPEILTFGEIARSWQEARGQKRPIVNLPLVGKTAKGFKEGYNCTPDHAEGRLRGASGWKRDIVSEWEANNRIGAARISQRILGTDKRIQGTGATTIDYQAPATSSRSASRCCSRVARQATRPRQQNQARPLRSAKVRPVTSRNSGEGPSSGW
jgi:nucleoside-diphosphate-sugar epimerase